MSLDVHQMAIAANQQHLLREAARNRLIEEAAALRVRPASLPGHAAAASFRTLGSWLRQALFGGAATTRPAPALPA